jgi:hypothetical protein
MVNISKKLLDITFQNPTCIYIIFTYVPAKRAKTIEGPMRSFPDAARKRIGNKRAVKKSI